MAEQKVQENKKSKKQGNKKQVDVKNMTQKQIWELKKEYFEHKIAVANGSTNDTAKLSKLRKNIARAKMYLKQREQNEEK